MDLASVIGIVAGVILVFQAMATGGGFSTFIDIPSALMVLGGTFAATLLAFKLSENPSSAAVLVIERACCTVSPTWMLPKSTGSGVCSDGLARRYTSAVTFTVCEGSDVVPNPLLPVPSDSRLMVAVPLFAPAVVVSIPTARLELSVAPGPSKLNDPPFVVASPVAPSILAFRLSE